MKQSKNTEYDLGDTSTPEKQLEENMEDVISDESTDTSATSIQEQTNETPKQSHDTQDKAADEDAKKRKRTEIESPGRKTRGSAKKTIIEEGKRAS
ncbi:hypothetical protein Tco_1261651 [Tanacetum coccineum]